MSDKKPETFEEQVAALRSRFGALDKGELVEVAVQLAQTYIVEGLSTLSQAAAVAAPQKGYDNVGDETFPGMLKRLKQQRPGDPVLEKFIVNGEHIQVRTTMGNVDVTEYRRPNAPPPTPGPAVGPNAAQQPANVPANRDSIYNRELYQQQANQGGGAVPPNPAAAPSNRPGANNAPPAATARPPANAGAAAKAAQPPTAGGAKTNDAKDDQKKGERFRMIELD